MEYLEPEQIEDRHFFCEITGLAQFWEEGESWNFIDAPRINSGFMLVLCDEVRFCEKNRAEVVFHKGDLLYIPQYAEYFVSFYGTHGEYSDIQTNFYIRDMEGQEYSFSQNIICVCQDMPPSLLKDFYNDMNDICRFTNHLKYPSLKIRRSFFALLQRVTACRMEKALIDREDSVISAALLYLDSHIGDNISVAELSKMCLLSESAFRKAFRLVTGFSPAQYKIRAKVAKAQTILASTPEISVAETAEQLGFYDVSYFYKVFEAMVGMTPKEYRDSVLHS